MLDIIINLTIAHAYAVMHTVQLA